MLDEAMTLLLRGRERIARPRGWCKGRLCKGDGIDNAAFCAVGAIFVQDDGRRPEPENTTWKAAVASLADALPVRQPCFWRDVVFDERAIASFNDRRATRKRDILALYDRAIAMRRQEMGVAAPAELPHRAHAALAEALTGQPA